MRKYQENLKTSQNYCSAFTPPHEMKILSALPEIAEKQKLNFSNSVLFHMKTKVCLKYFASDWVLSKFCVIITMSKEKSFPMSLGNASFYVFIF